MARKKTIVELVQARARAEARVLRVARVHGDADLFTLTTAAENLHFIEEQLLEAEREAQREVRKLVRKPRLVR